MESVKYVFNEKTLQFERYRVSPKQRARQVFSIFATILVTGILFSIFLYTYFPSPQQKLMENEIKQLTYHVNLMSQNYDKLTASLNKLHEKDNNVHRMIFGVNPMDEDVWEGGIGGHDKYEYLNAFAESGDILRSALLKMDKLNAKAELQKRSLDSLYNLAVEREKKLASTPSIKPVSAGKLKKNIEFLSGFGMRIHPIYKIKKFHAGIDFTSPQGTHIQATGDGKVKSVTKSKSGYGNTVTIDHGFGYETLYAHMNTIDVKVGQTVTKGLKIGTVGSTGTSTAPHLHYEVHFNGKPINPINYVMDGLTPKEYRELVAKANEENQSWD